MLDKHDPALLPWLVSRGPAGNTELFRKVFEGGPDTWRSPTAAGDASPAPVADAPVEGAETAEPTSVEDAPTEPMVPTGRTTATDKQVAVPLRILRQHSVVFAGSGSGKTVLLRRLIEECALHGVSSIVLDPNNDLARLGDTWPAAPAGWNPGDAARAGEYLAGTDVVVWTPRKQHGRPLVLRPLPVFADVLDDREEFEQVVEAAVAGLVPRVRLTASKLDIGTAVLKQALAYYAQDGSSDLTGFVELLLDLPDGVSDFRGAAKLAADMAERLKAATIVDPLFGGEGAPLDPGILLTPAPGKRARVSVISFIGLPTDAQRQTFVNQLQLALFSWIKKNPAGDRPLGGLLVMDEAQDFAPSGAATACTESTLKLSAQARKYGLGLMFATQAPRGLHNRIPGNAATQFFGRLNSGVQINAAAELARRKGGDVEDIARLTSGLFYAASDGVRFDKVRMPMCLSHHPSSALTEEEVLARAQGRVG
jgi:DNA helicase HerA-like ATPase